jgi:hypothetical protein
MGVNRRPRGCGISRRLASFWQAKFIALRFMGKSVGAQNRVGCRWLRTSSAAHPNHCAAKFRTNRICRAARPPARHPPPSEFARNGRCLAIPSDVDRTSNPRPDDVPIRSGRQRTPIPPRLRAARRRSWAASPGGGSLRAAAGPPAGPHIVGRWVASPGVGPLGAAAGPPDGPHIVGRWAVSPGLARVASRRSRHPRRFTRRSAVGGPGSPCGTGRRSGSELAQPGGGLAGAGPVGPSDAPPSAREGGGVRRGARRG